MGIQINHEIRIPFWRTRIKWKVRSCCFFFSVSHFDDVSCVASSFCSPISIFVSVYIYIYLFTYIHVTCLSIHHGQGSAVSLSFFFAERRCCGSEFRYLGPIKWYVLPPHGAVTKKHPGYLLYICTFKCMCIHLYIYIFFFYMYIFLFTRIYYIYVGGILLPCFFGGFWQAIRRITMKKKQEAMFHIIKTLPGRDPFINLFPRSLATTFSP